MAQLLRLRQAARQLGVSPSKLYRAIADGRLAAQLGGGPGKPTLISLEALHAFGISEGLIMQAPVPASERLERSQLPAIADMVNRLDQMFAGMERLERLVGEVLERLEPSPGQPAAAPPPPAAAERSEHSTPVSASPSKAELITWLRTLQGAGMSLQNMAHELNARGIPTLSGRGRWHKGTIGKFLAPAEEGPQ
jgi:excisionase family DNA binding protein